MADRLYKPKKEEIKTQKTGTYFVVDKKAKKSYEEYSRKELIREIEKLKKRKKYGLVWEDKPEKVAELCKEKLPILEEDKKKEIKTDEKKPVNILIEGDNYHALSVLNYTHKGKIDVIYIDPPYNTGNKEFVFNDKIIDLEDSYRHSKWLSFMEKRLKLAKNLLKDGAAIFISIDNNEVSQLKVLCDETFGEKNFVANIIWNKTDTNRKGSQYIKIKHEYILCYLKGKRSEKNTWQINKQLSDTVSFSNPDNDPRGEWFSANVCSDNYKKGSKNCFEITSPSGKIWKRKWFKPKEEILELIKENKIYFGENGNNVPRLKLFKSEWENLKTFVTSVWSDVGGFSDARKEYETIIGKEIPFETPKSLKMLKRIINMSSNKNATILDFFAGSGTTGQATLELNKKDVGNRKFILCTNNENNICTKICYPRIKRTIKGGYKDLEGRNVNENKGNLKYFKTDFVDARPTDRNKKRLVNKSTEMLCLKEDCFDVIMKCYDFRIFTNSQGKNLGIIYDDDGIKPFKKEVKKLKKKFVVYVFSLDESAREEEFEDVAGLVQLKPIPAVILNVYKRIFK